MLYPCQEDRNERDTEVYTISDKLATRKSHSVHCQGAYYEMSTAANGIDWAKL